MFTKTLRGLNYPLSFVNSPVTKFSSVRRTHSILTRVGRYYIDRSDSQIARRRPGERMDRILDCIPILYSVHADGPTATATATRGQSGITRHITPSPDRSASERRGGAAPPTARRPPRRPRCSPGGRRPTGKVPARPPPAAAPLSLVASSLDSRPHGV